MDASLFRELNETETEEFKLWARENYVPGDNIPIIWHPVIRKECAKINEEDK